MRTPYLLAIVLPIVVLAGFGCVPGGVSDRAAKVKDTVQTAQNVADLARIGEKASEAANTNSPEAIAEAIGQYADFASKIELQQFEKVQPVDAPEGFPKDLIYANGKLTESSDDSSESYLNKDISIKTTESLTTVRDFYKNLLGKDPWKITSQSNDADSSSIYAKNKDGMEVSVRVSGSQYSKLVEVSIDYSGDVAE